MFEITIESKLLPVSGGATSIVQAKELTEGWYLLIESRIPFLYFFSNHSLAKIFGTEISMESFCNSKIEVFLNHVVKLAFEIESSNSPNTACHSSLLVI